jgi:quercetin dioxygenase-like cupin family protein
VIDWAAVPMDDAGNGITRQTVHGDRSTVVRYVYPPGSVFATHQHPEEQLTVVLTGRITFTTPSGDVSLGPGGSLLVPPNLRHGARVDGDETVESINVLAPRRERSPSA